jgi:serine/threonine protein kinase
VARPVLVPSVTLSNVHASHPSRLSDRYTLEEPIGYGGMGQVYHVHDEVIDRDVAVKLLDEAVSDQHDVARASLAARRPGPGGRECHSGNPLAQPARPRRRRPPRAQHGRPLPPQRRARLRGTVTRMGATIERTCDEDVAGIEQSAVRPFRSDV